ncbi:inner membrane transporter RhtA [Amycolatopsis marina]|uniref:Inner membrane transporter RhtA n=1 Tax=Amycolatopsis marina TaxID=490629 RepID=A0A1I0VXZ0_9PSEU|nr:EamA family transporter [Amycolatopsis marina]SFA81279.1 inner membrane transporter RhtA [Amycolatopsis marina]
MTAIGSKLSAPAPVLVLGSVVSVQFGQAFGKQLFDQLSPSGVVSLRLGFAALVLLAIHRPGAPWSRERLLLACSFGTAIAGMNLIYPALRHLPLGVATTLQLLGPLVLALVSSRRPVDVGFAAIAAAGVWLFHAQDAAGLPVEGALLALGSGAAMAGYLLLSTHAGKHSADGSLLAIAVAWAAVLTIPFGVAENGATLLNPPVLAAGAGVAVLSAVLPYSLDLAALRRLPPRVVGVLESLEPAVAGLAGLLLLQEFLGPRQWIGVTCVVLAAGGTSWRATRPRGT